MLRVSSIQTEKADMNSESEIKSSTTNFLGQKSIGFQFGPLNKVFFLYTSIRMGLIFFLSKL